MLFYIDSAFQMICDPHIDARKLAEAFPDLFQHLFEKTILLERLSIEGNKNYYKSA